MSEEEREEHEELKQDFFFFKTKDLKIDMWENNESFKELRSPGFKYSL